MRSAVYKIMVFCLIVLGMVSLPGMAHAFVMNGDLSDWGVTPRAFNNGSDWAPDAGIQSVVEDQIDNYLTPGYGGQLFDAEAMYAAFDGANLYFAVVTGHPPEGASGYRPGDIAFDFGRNGSFEYAFETVSRCSLKAGDLYSVKKWQYGLWNTTDPTEIKDIDKDLGKGELFYNNKYYGESSQGSHYVIEGSIPKAYFGDDWGKNFTMSWTETCGNDVIRLDVTPTPEPATMALFGLGLAGLGVLRRKYV